MLATPDALDLALTGATVEGAARRYVIGGRRSKARPRLRLLPCALPAREGAAHAK
jgi:hypothetical protein